VLRSSHLILLLLHRGRQTPRQMPQEQVVQQHLAVPLSQPLGSTLAVFTALVCRRGQ
jgi:hypothetical protein